MSVVVPFMLKTYSHYVMNGGNLYVLSKLLGHSSIKITEVYAHLCPDYLMDIGKYVDFKRAS